MKIKSIEKSHRDPKENVYNLHVKDNHNYYVENVLVSNCHVSKKNNLISKYINRLSTNIRMGFTGTLPDDIEDEWHVKGIIGPVLVSEEVYTLQDKGYLANINIHPIKISHTYKPKFKYETFEDYKMAFHTEWHHIEETIDSNKTIVTIAKQLKNNTLILFDHIKHGEMLFNLLDHKHKYFIDGSVDLDIREDIRQEMEDNNNIITII